MSFPDEPAIRESMQEDDKMFCLGPGGAHHIVELSTTWKNNKSVDEAQRPLREAPEFFSNNGK